MARLAYGCTLSQQLADGSYIAMATAMPSEATTMTTLAAQLTTLDGQITSAQSAVAGVESAVATLEADGATPTQAHVTALRAAWNTEKAACTAIDHSAVDATLTTFQTLLAVHAIFNFDTTACPDGNAIRAAMSHIMSRVLAQGYA